MTLIALLVVVIPDYNSLSDIVINPGEQILQCSKKIIEVHYSSEDIKVYGSEDGEPSISSEHRDMSVNTSGHLAKRSYNYKGYFLVPSTVLSISLTMESPKGKLVVIRGSYNMKKYMDEDDYSYVYKSSGYTNEYVLDVVSYDEYFIVAESIDGTYYSLAINGTLAAFDTENLTELCVPYKPVCTVNKDAKPNYCVLLEYNVSSIYSAESIDFKFKEKGGKLSDQEIATIVTSIALALSTVYMIVSFVFLCRGDKKDRYSELATPLST